MSSNDPWRDVVNLEALTQLNLKITIDTLNEVIGHLKECRELLECCLTMKEKSCADRVICSSCGKPMGECQCEHTSTGKEVYNG